MNEPMHQGAGAELLARIPVTASTVLEVGARDGELGRAWLSRQPLGRHHSISWSALGSEPMVASADVVVLNRCLDSTVQTAQAHEVLTRVRHSLPDGALLVVEIENAAHWSQVTHLLGGGAPQRTWTLRAAAQLLESSGWALIDATPAVAQPPQTEAALKTLVPAARALGIAQAQAQRELMADRWIIRALAGPASPPLSIAALGLRKVAGVTEARVDHPLQALNSLPTVRAVWSSAQLQIPPDWPPGILILHRQFMIQPEFNAVIERLITKGWMTVADMDDDPHHWKEYPASGFRAFRGVHAVSVSTPALATLMQQWNPTVAVFPNAATHRVELEATRSPEAVPRIFFGALNRGGDWGPLREGLHAAARELGAAAEWVVIHDQAFFDMLPPEVPKTFHPTLPPDRYQDQLRHCDISLLPLADTPFNRLKSDLKFVESCAAGVVPICSETVYGERAIHRDIALFAQSPDQWAQALRRLVREPQERALRRQRGLDYVKRERMMSQQVEPRLRFYRDLLARRSELEAQRRARLRELGEACGGAG